MLEVLGAAALLAFAYIALTRSEIEGLRSEQESNRRLQASLLADAHLADLELLVASGTAPALGSTQEEEAPFVVRTEVRAFEPPPPRQDAHRGGPPEGSLAARRAEHEKAKQGKAASLFAAPKAGEADPPIRTIEIAVQWNEGVYEREVRRTTFALDPIAVEALLAEVQANAAPTDEEGAKDDGKGGPKDSKKPRKTKEPPAPMAGPDDEPPPELPEP
jgi:hypothetical protein